MFNIRFVNYNKVFVNKNFLDRVFVKAYGSSSQPAVQDNQENYEKQLRDFETLTNITKKVRQKKPQRPPFAKNLLIGVFDTEILTYPQLEKEEVENLEQNVNPLEKALKLPHMKDCNTLSNKNFRQNLSDYRAIGLQASQFMDGRECNVTESCRFLEALSEHSLRDSLISNEQLGIQTLVKFGSDHLKKKYLSPIMKGESLSTFCLSELGLSDINSFKTKAELSSDKKSWILNGEKSWVVNGMSADVLVVFALSKVITRDSIKETKITAFVVEKDSPGVSFTQKDGYGIETADITFKDTMVPAENVIGEVHNADQILSTIITQFRLSTGPACTVLTKKIINQLSDSILEQSNDRNLWYKSDALRGKIGEIATNLYAMESASYLTAGLIDSYENQDCELECAIVKVFCAENNFQASKSCLDLIGTPATSTAHWANKYHQESLRYLTLNETNDSLKMIIALLGLQHAGLSINEKINKLRNPLFHGGYIIKRMWTNRKNIEDTPKLDLELGDHLHPSIFASSQQLEYCVKRLEFATEILLARNGPSVVNKHIDLRRLADCIIDTYVMTACLGRASRSYCIGLQHGNYEMLLATAFCINAVERVKANVQKIFYGSVQTNDDNNKAIGKQVFKSKGFFIKHPLARNF